MRTFFIVTLTLVAVLVASWALLQPPASPRQSQSSVAPTQMNQPSSSPVVREGRVVFDVSLHSARQISDLLTRAEQLSHRLSAEQQYSDVALVLHGPEIEFFARQNYERYKGIVDLATQLDAQKVIDIKICRTKMRELGIEAADLPTFVEQVPYGPDEIERLRQQGYLRL